LSDEATIDALESALKDAGFEPGDERARRSFVSAAFRDGESFKDQETVRRYAWERFNSERAVREAEERLGGAYRSPDVGTRVRFVIARLIEDRFGQTERSNYFVAMFTGEAP
jgi:hypothetical protein